MRRAAGSKRSAIPPTSPPRSPSISPSRLTCRCSPTRSRRRLRGKGIDAEFVALDDLPARLGELAPRRDRTIVWTLNDGVRFYRGSSVPALARLAGFARFGSPPPRRTSAQDKFASLALASAAGLPVPPTRLMEGDTEIAALGDWPGPHVPLFVKPNTLGAKIGIFADSLCRDRLEANDRARRIWERYRDRALIQPFVEGDDVRVSFMDLGGEIRRSVRRRTDRQGSDERDRRGAFSP